MQKKEFYKFTDAHSGQMIYVDLNTIIGIRETSDYNNHHNTLTSTNIHVATNQVYTTLFSHYGLQFNVSEHITEVIALLEGRDPAPARILFKGK